MQARLLSWTAAQNHPRILILLIQSANFKSIMPNFSLRTCSARWITLLRKTTILKVSCFKIDFVHVLPSSLLESEGILDEIISIV